MLSRGCLLGRPSAATGLEVLLGTFQNADGFEAGFSSWQVDTTWRLLHPECIRMIVQEIRPPPVLTIPAVDDDEAVQLQMPYCPNIKQESVRVYKCLLGSLFVRKHFPAGSDIAIQGSKAEVVIYIEDGECEILFSDKHEDVDEDFEGSEVSPPPPPP